MLVLDYVFVVVCARLGALAPFMVSLLFSYAATFDIFEVLVFSFHLTLASHLVTTLSPFWCVSR